jgi:phosphatidylinositol alpha-1,6-mannosyltransferase
MAMKVLLITNDYPPIISGISTVFCSVWKLLAPEMNMVVAPRINGYEAIDSRVPSPTVRYPFVSTVSPVGKTVNLVALFFYTLAVVVKYGVRAIHAGQVLSPGFVCFLFKKFFHMPYFLWVYGGETTEAYTKSKVLFFLMKRIILASERIFTNSPFVTEEFADFGIDRGKTIEILPAVDSSVFRPELVSEELIVRHTLAGKKILLTVSRLTERKGNDLVLKALVKLVDHHPEILYLIVGKGPDEKRLRSLARHLDLENHVIFAGAVEERDLPHYYNLCDVYVMPNREVLSSTDSIEGFGISFIEANACGKPVIGGRSGGAEAAIVDGETGFLVDPSNVDELTSKIKLLIEDFHLARSMGRKGRLRVEREFSWEDRARVISQLHKEYHESSSTAILSTL